MAMAMRGLLVLGGVLLSSAQTQNPDKTDGTKLYMSKVGSQTARINWAKPGVGTHKAAILGYKLQLQEVCAVTTEVKSVENTVLQKAITSAYGGAGQTFTDSSVSCTKDYTNTATEPVCAMVGTKCVPPTDGTFPTTKTSAWLDVTGVYTPTSGQNHDGECKTTCETTACSAVGGDPATIISKCSGCLPQNPETDVGCFPGASGFPTDPNLFHDVAGLQPGKYYKFRVKAFNVFGEGPWSTAGYAVHMHTTPNAPTWPTAIITDKKVDGTSVKLNWVAPDNFGRGTDECASTSARTTALTKLSCAKSAATLFDACDANNDKTADATEIGNCACISGAGSISTATINREKCSTQGTAAKNSGSASSSGDITYEIKYCKGSGCTPISITGDSSMKGITAVEKTISGLKAGTEYSFTVTASNAVGAGAASIKTTYTTHSVPAAPTLAPTVTAVSDTTVTVSWSAAIDQVPALSNLGYDVKTAKYGSGFELYAQSCNQADQSTCNTGTDAHWSPAARSSLDSDGVDIIAAKENILRGTSATNDDVSYEKDSGSSTLVASTGTWLKLTHFTSQTYRIMKADGKTEVKTYTAPGSCAQPGDSKECAVDTVTVPYLAQGTKYRFMVKYVNAAGKSAVSPSSIAYETLDSAVSNLRIYSGPPCVYKPGTAKKKTVFAASATGTNVRYFWELVEESESGTSVLYVGSKGDSGGSAIGKCVDSETVCSVMEYELPFPGRDESANKKNYDQIKLRVLAYNDRGILTEELAFGYVDDDTNGAKSHDINTIEYCGCTDSTDPSYWSDATYMIPTMCTSATQFATTAEVTTVTKGKWEYFQFFFQADTHDAEVTLRVDVGDVDVYIGTEGVPDANQPHTYSSSKTGVSNFFIASVPYSALSKSTTGSVYVAVKGVSSFSRIQVLGRTSDFTPTTGARKELKDQSTMKGTCTANTPTNLRDKALCDAVTNLDSDTACKAVKAGAPSASICTYAKTGITTSVKTNSYDFYEFFYPHADNDIDVQVSVTTATKATEGGVILYASTSERYPSPIRATSTYAGYWEGTGHTGEVKAATETFTYTIRPQTNAGQDGTLYVAVKGRKPDSWAIGDPLPTTPYTISAKVFRYRIASALLEPGRPVGVKNNDAVGGSDTDEDRYSVASSDNFNYYEVKVSKATYRLTATITVHYGTVKVVTSSTTLPTQDESLHKNAAGTVIGSSTSYSTGGPYTLSIPYSYMNVKSGYVYVGIIATSATEASYDIVVKEDTFGVKAPTDIFTCDANTDVGKSSATTTVASDSTCTTLPGCDAVVGTCSSVTLQRRVPDLGGSTVAAGAAWTKEGTDKIRLSADGGLRVSNNNIHASVMKGQTIKFVNKAANTCPMTQTVKVVSTSNNDITVSGDLTTNLDVAKCNVVRMASAASADQMAAKYYGDDRDGYHFFQMYVGPKDVAHEVAARTNAGSLPSDISSDPDSWGIDWTTPFSQTWKDSKTDEWDLDVDIGFTGMTVSANADSYQIFASTREKYPSLQRAYDEAVSSSTIGKTSATSLYSVAGPAATTFNTAKCTLKATDSSINDIGACIDKCDALGDATKCNALVYDATGKKCKQFLCASDYDWTVVKSGTATDVPYRRAKHGATSMVLPTYTFSSSMVYFSIFLPSHVNKVSGNLVIAQSDKDSKRALSSDTTVTSRCKSDGSTCSNHGNCIDDPQDGEHAAAPYCICDDGYSGADCSTSTEWGGAATAASIASTAAFIGKEATGNTWRASTTDKLAAAAAVADVSSVTLKSASTPAIAGALNGFTITLTNAANVAMGGAGTIVKYAANHVAHVQWSTKPTTTPTTDVTYVISDTCSTGNRYGDYISNGVMAGALVLASTESTVFEANKNKHIATAGGAGHGEITAVETIVELTLSVALNGDCADGKIVQKDNGDIMSTLVGDHQNGATKLTVKMTKSGFPSGALAIKCDKAGTVRTATIQAGGVAHKAGTSPKVTVTWIGSAPTTSSSTTYTISESGCAAGNKVSIASHANTWDAATKTCSTKNTWEPYVEVGGANQAKQVLTGCTPLWHAAKGMPFAANGNLAACKALCDANSKCNGFVHKAASPATCRIYECPKGFDDFSSAVELSRKFPPTKEEAGTKSYFRQSYTCCASTTATTAEFCADPIPGVTSKAACEQVLGATTEAECKTPYASSVATCATVANVKDEAACELAPFPEVPAAQCPPAALKAGVSNCDAFDTVKLDCSTQKCTPTGTNAYKVGYVTCPGGVCTINAPKPIVEVPYSVKNVPKYGKVATYVDSNPYPAKGANVVQYASSTVHQDSSVKIYDLKPLSAGKKHTVVLMLLTEAGEPLGTQVKQFEVGYGGGCAVAPDGKTCGGNGACYLGYCVCYDGWYGASCTNSVQEDGSTCAAKSATNKNACVGASDASKSFSCQWKTNTLPAPGASDPDSAGTCTASLAAASGFKAGDVYEKRVAKLTQSKLGEARFLNTRMLETTQATITKSNAALTAKDSSTNSKLQLHATGTAASVSASKAATQLKVDALYAKMERNAIVIQQAREESLRSQTSNLEAKLELQRALASHQTEVQNRFQSKRFGVYKLNALKQDKLKQEFARSRFTINQLKTANGPTVDTTKFKESSCTTDQFYNVQCKDTISDKQSLYTGNGYVSAQTVPASDTTAIGVKPSDDAVTVDGAVKPGQYNGINRG